MATHSSVLAWEIPGTGEPGGLPSMGLRESDTTEWLHFTFIYTHTHTHTDIYVCACVNVCVCITESLCCTSESNTLQIHYVLRCPVLCGPVDYSLQGLSVQGILQARILEWIAVPSSKGSSQPRDWVHVSKSPALADRLFTASTTWEAYLLQLKKKNYLRENLSLKKNNPFNLQSYLLIYKNRKLTAKKHIAPRDGIVSNNLQMWTGMKMNKDRHSGKWRKEPQKSSGQEIACSNWEENSSLIKEFQDRKSVV